MANVWIVEWFYDGGWCPLSGFQPSRRAARLSVAQHKRTDTLYNEKEKYRVRKYERAER